MNTNTNTTETIDEVKAKLGIPGYVWLRESFTSGDATIYRFFDAGPEGYHERSRYTYDNCLKDFAQYDTDQDASYFGVWVSESRKVTVTYAEGDVTVVECGTVEAFKKELAEMAQFYNFAPMAVAYDADGTRTEIYDESALHGRTV